MSAAISKREIERRIAAVKAANVEVAGVRFEPDGTMTILTSAGGAVADGDGGPDDTYERWERQKAAAKRARGAQATARPSRA
ncbi:MAG: hypothetical protein AB7M12_12390 [Hyphomonadaceae bacterium]